MKSLTMHDSSDEALQVVLQCLEEDEGAVGGPQVWEAARHKRKSVAKSPGGSAKKPARGRPKRDEDEEEEEEEGDRSGDDRGDGSGGGDDPSDPEDDELGAVDSDIDAHIVARGQVREANFPGATARGDPLFWEISCQRPANKGWDRSWIVGPMRFPRKSQAVQFAAGFREQFATHMSLSTFQQAFVDFAGPRADCCVANPAAVGDLVGSGCPITGLAVEDHSTVSSARMGLNELSGHRPPASCRRVTFRSDELPDHEVHLVWSVWVTKKSALRELMEDWDRQRPHATLAEVDSILMQVRVPTTDQTEALETVQARAAAINCTPAPPTPEGGHPVADAL